MKKYIKTAFFVFLGIMVVLQFVPSGNTNNSKSPQPNSLEKSIHLPEDILSALKDGCYDCHSNNTRYPWYSKIQPIAWWLNSHIIEGKEHLNFDEFGNLDKESQSEMMEEIAEEIEEHQMPLSSYRWMHPKARFSDSTINKIVSWLKKQK